jgi:hypothetical protein
MRALCIVMDKKLASISQHRGMGVRSTYRIEEVFDR